MYIFTILPEGKNVKHFFYIIRMCKVHAMYIWQLLAIQSGIVILLSAFTLASGIPQQMPSEEQVQEQDAFIFVSGYLFSIDLATKVKSFIIVVDEYIELDESVRVISYCHGEDDSNSENENDETYDYTIGSRTKVCLFCSFVAFSSFCPFLRRL